MKNEISRRSMIGLSSAAMLAGVAAGEALPADKTAHASTPKWEVFEVTFDGPASGNPFVDVELTASFQCGNRKISVDGFYDGSGKYKLRFMPDDEGH